MAAPWEKFQTTVSNAPKPWERHQAKKVVEPYQRTVKEYQDGGYASLPEGDSKRAGYDATLNKSIGFTNDFVSKGEWSPLYKDLPVESVNNIFRKISAQNKEHGQVQINAENPRGHEALIKKLIETEKLRLKTPERADLAESIGPVEGLAIGFQGGLRTVARGVGLPSDQGNIDAENLAKEHGPGSVKLGQFAGEVAPFVPAGVATAGIKSVVGRTAALSTLGGVEGGVITAGKGGDATDIIKGAVAGTVFGAAGNLAIPVVSRISRKYFNKVDLPEKSLIKPNGEPIPELQKALDDAGKTIDDIVEESTEGANIVEDVAKASHSEKGPSLEKIAQQAQPSTSRVEAAKSFKLKDVPAAVLSDDQAFQEAAGTLAAVPASTSGIALDKFKQDLSKKADDLIEELGGSLDKHEVTDNLRTKISKTRESLMEQESQLYDAVGNTVPDSVRVKTESMLNVLNAEVRRSGGVKELDPSTRKVYQLLKRNPTYHRIDRERKEIGAALGKKQGVYKDANDATLSKLYGQLTDLQEGVAGTYGGADAWTAAKKLTVKRKAIEDGSKLLFGKELMNGFMPTLQGEIKRLSQGNAKKFDEIIAAIPKEERAGVVASALNGVFTNPNSPNQSLTASQFAKWFDGLKRSPRAYNRIKDNLPKGGIERLEALHDLSRGLANVEKNRIKTGIAKTFFDDFDKSNGIAAKLYGISEKADLVPGLGASGLPQAVRVTSKIAQAAAKNKETSIVAADRLLSSDRFKKAIIDAAIDPDSQKAKLANEALKKTRVYRDYLAAQPKDTRAAMLQAGLIPFLLSGDKNSNE